MAGNACVAGVRGCGDAGVHPSIVNLHEQPLPKASLLQIKQKRAADALDVEVGIAREVLTCGGL